MMLVDYLYIYMHLNKVVLHKLKDLLSSSDLSCSLRIKLWWALAFILLNGLKSSLSPLFCQQPYASDTDIQSRLWQSYCLL